jgi:predicted outer membrane protein
MMHNNNYPAMRTLKMYLIISSIVVLALIVAACESGKRADKRDAQDIRESQRARGVPETTEERSIPRTDDQIFVTTVIDDIDWLIVWLNAGLMKSTDTRHKVHAEAMLADHAALLARLASYAYGEGYNIPKVDTGNVINIIRKAGKGWDKDWTKAMAEKQQSLINKLEARKGEINTKELSDLIDQALPIMRQHLEMTRELRATPIH